MNPVFPVLVLEKIKIKMFKCCAEYKGTYSTEMKNEAIM